MVKRKECVAAPVVKGLVGLMFWNHDERTVFLEWSSA